MIFLLYFNWIIEKLYIPQVIPQLALDLLVLKIFLQNKKQFNHTQPYPPKIFNSRAHPYFTIIFKVFSKLTFKKLKYVQRSTGCHKNQKI